MCVECLAIQARIELVQKRILNLIYNIEYIRVLISKEVVNTGMFEYSLPKLGQGDLLKNVPWVYGKMMFNTTQKLLCPLMASDMFGEI